MYSSVLCDIRGLISFNGEERVVWDVVPARNGTCKALARPRMTGTQINFMLELDTWGRFLSKLVRGLFVELQVKAHYICHEEPFVYQVSK